MFKVSWLSHLLVSGNTVQETEEGAPRLLHVNLRARRLLFARRFFRPSQLLDKILKKSLSRSRRRKGQWLPESPPPPPPFPIYVYSRYSLAEAEYKEKRSVWDPVPELTITLSQLQKPTHVPWATLCQVDLNPIPKSTLSPSQGFRIWHQGWWREGRPNHTIVQQNARYSSLHLFHGKNFKKVPQCREYLYLGSSVLDRVNALQVVAHKLLKLGRHQQLGDVGPNQLHHLCKDNMGVRRKLMLSICFWGRILGQHPEKSLKSFPPCYSKSPLSRNLIYSNSRSPLTVSKKEKGGKPNPLPYGLRHLKSENSHDYAQKPYWKCTFMSSASGFFV